MKGMQTGSRFHKLINKLVILLIFSCAFNPASLAFAQNPLSQPLGEIDPGRVGESVSPRPFEGPPTPLPPGALEAPQEHNIGPEAAQLRFRLRRIIIRNPLMFSENELLAPHLHRFEKEVCLADIQEIAN